VFLFVVLIIIVFGSYVVGEEGTVGCLFSAPVRALERTCCMYRTSSTSAKVVLIWITFMNDVKQVV
jgi:hypothetical protein